MKKPKVYEMNDCDWWVDFSPEEARKNYSDFVEGDDTDDPVELTEEDLSSLTFFSEESETITFKEQLECMIKKGEVFPCFFASTEY